MAAPKVGLLSLALVLTGCVSAGPRPDDLPRVPVYQIGEETPCDYELIRRVVAEQGNTGRSDQDFRLAMQRALGIAGAEAGADAVIVRDYVRRLLFTTTRTGLPPSPSPPLMFEGEAVRWIEGTCKRYGPEALSSLSG